MRLILGLEQCPQPRAVPSFAAVVPGQAVLYAEPLRFIWVTGHSRLLSRNWQHNTLNVSELHKMASLHNCALKPDASSWRAFLSKTDSSKLKK